MVFSPVLSAGNSISEKLNNIKLFLISKNTLYLENQALRLKLSENDARMANYNSVILENLNLKETLGRKNSKTNMILAAILSKPNQSPYDTLVIDAGMEQGVKEGNTVFALGNIPIGVIAKIYPHSSKVVLFSSSGEKTQAVTPPGNVYLELVGRGGGNFEMIIPADFKLARGDEIVLPGITPYVLAIAETIISDPRDSFIRALLVSPANIQELKFVEVELR